MKKFHYYLCLLLWLVGIASLNAQGLVSVQRLSQDSTGAGVNAAVGSSSISPNGDKVVFSSAASNLVSSDSNGRTDVFLRDLVSGEVQRVNLGLNGLEADDDSNAAVISPVTPNGFYAVAFESDATNLARSATQFPDTNNRRDIYFSLPGSGNRVERASVATGGTEGNLRSNEPSITVKAGPNKVLIAYTSRATNFISGDLNGNPDIYLTTISSPEDDAFSPATHIQTERVSRGVDGGEPNGDCTAPQISADGRFVVFESTATNIVSGITPTTKQIYRYEIATQTAILISKAADGTPGNGDSQGASISYAGNFIVYATAATNIIQDGFVPSGSGLQIMRYDVRKNTTMRVNTSAAGVQSNSTSSANVTASISPNGRLVLLSDSADNLVSDDANGVNDVYLKDLSNQEISRLSRPLSGGEGDGVSFLPVLALSAFNSTDVRPVYTSSATNLISGDTEGRNDIFLSSATVANTKFIRSTFLEVPADVTPTGSNIAVTLQKFMGINLSAATLNTQLATTAAATRKIIQYRTIIQRQGVSGNARDIRRKLSKRNEIAFGSLKSGTYSVKYQVRILRDGQIIRHTSFSPTVFVSPES